jgi:hypothetical protein
MAALCTQLRTSALAGPMLSQNQLTHFGPLTQSLLPLFSLLPTHTHVITLNTDNINMPSLPRQAQLALHISGQQNGTKF